jgi:hypothetical protein
MFRRCLVSILVTATTGACHPAPTLLMPPPDGAGSPGPVPGTYAVWFCRHDCAASELTRTAIAYGFIVLDTVPLADWSGTHMSRAERVSRLQGNLPGACYLVIGHRAVPSDAGAIGRAMSGWRPVGPDSATALGFTRGVDRGYIGSVRIDRATGRLEGLARSTGNGIARGTPAPPDTIVGHRIGPDDRHMCSRRLNETM